MGPSWWIACLTTHNAFLNGRPTSAGAKWILNHPLSLTQPLSQDAYYRRKGPGVIEKSCLSLKGKETSERNYTDIMQVKVYWIILALMLFHSNTITLFSYRHFLYHIIIFPRSCKIIEIKLHSLNTLDLCIKEVISTFNWTSDKQTLC